jgi:pilus assembly protein Flp/PilA
MLKRFLQDESGAAAIEYGLIVALISLILITSLTIVGKNLSSNYLRIAQIIQAIVDGNSTTP